jgi:hypothetical protein
MLDIIIYNNVNNLKNLYLKNLKIVFYFLIKEKNFHLNKYY